MAIIDKISSSSPDLWPAQAPDVATVSQAEHFNVEIHTTYAAMQALEGPWRELENASAQPQQIFQTYDWCAAWVSVYDLSDSPNQPYIVTVKQHERLVLILPLMRDCAGPVCLLRPLSEPFSQYGDCIMAADNIDPTEVIGQAWQALKEHSHSDILMMRHVRIDSALYPFLKAHATKWGVTHHAPYMDFTDYPSEELYEARYNKSQRRRRKRIRAELEKIGPVTFACQTGDNISWPLVKQAIYEKRVWLSARGLYSQPLHDPKLEKFLAALNLMPDNDCSLTVSSIHAGERPISFEIGLRFKGHHFGFITAHDQELTNASPARLHMDMSQRQAIKDGLVVFDLMVPADPHKETWSNAATEAHDFYMPISWRGRLFGKLYLINMRRFIRKVYLTVPRGLRRHITRLIDIR